METGSPMPDDEAISRMEQSRWQHDMQLLGATNPRLGPNERAEVDMTDSVITSLKPTEMQRKAMTSEMNKDLASKNPEAIENMKQIELMQITRVALLDEEREFGAEVKPEERMRLIADYAREKGVPVPTTKEGMSELYERADVELADLWDERDAILKKT